MKVDQLLEKLRVEFSLLIEAGFVAVNKKNETLAVTLFNAAQAIEPYSVIPKLGFGFIELNKLEIDNAMKYFTEVLEQEPEHHLAKVFMGMCLAFNPKTRAEGKSYIKVIKQQTNDDHIKHLCEISLLWIDKDFKD